MCIDKCMCIYGLIFMFCVTTRLYSSESVVDMSHEIAGMADSEAKSLVQSAYASVAKELSKLDAIWNEGSDQQQRAKALSSAHAHIMRSSASPVVRAFGYYAWEHQPERFKNLRKTVHWSFSTTYNTVCSVTTGMPHKILAQDDFDVVPDNERSQDMLHIKFRSPDRKLDFTSFFPASPEHVACRLMSDWGHELGHVLNEYHARKCFVPFICDLGFRYCTRVIPTFLCLGCAPYLFPSLCLALIEIHVGLFLGGVAAASAGALGLVLISLERCEKRLNEYAADATSLALMPRSTRNGVIIPFIEYICRDYRYNMWQVKNVPLKRRLWLFMQERCKCLVFLRHSIHPADQQRIRYLMNILVRDACLQDRLRVVEQLEQIAYNTVHNYSLQFGTDMAYKAAKKAYRDVVGICTEIRSRYELPTTTSMPDWLPLGELGPLSS